MYTKKTRIVSILCIILTLFSFVTTCFTGETVYADSNDNRALDLAIAEGKTRTEISEIATNQNGSGVIDMNSMRAIALYLSNFYQPFVTSLTDGSDIGVSDKTADDAKAEKQNEQMGQFSTDAINALTKYCGVDEEVAKVLAKATLKQSLDTCHNVYVNKHSVEVIMNVDLHTVANTLQPSNNGKDYYGLAGMSRETTMGKVDVWRVGGNNKAEALGYNFDNTLLWVLKGGKNKKTVQDYINKLYEDGGSLSVNGNDYVPLTYFLYLTIIQYAANNALPNSGDTETKSLLNFYWYDTDTNSMIPCFDAGGTCTQAFLMSTNEIDIKNGVGTSLSSLDLETYDSLSEDAKKGEELRKATIFFNPIFVNWVGDLVINDGHNTFVMVPGCLNPYSLVTISDKKTDYLNGISVKALTYKANELLESSKDKKVSAVTSIKEDTSLGGNVDTTMANTVLSLIKAKYGSNISTNIMSDIAVSTELDYGDKDNYKYRAKITKGFYDIFYNADTAMDSRVKKDKWTSPLVINLDTNEICVDNDIDLSGEANKKSDYILVDDSSKTDKNLLVTAYNGIKYCNIKLFKPKDNKVYNCVVLYSMTGFKNLLEMSDYDIGSRETWSVFIKYYDKYCDDKEFRTNMNDTATSLVNGKKTASKDTKKAVTNCVDLCQILDNLKLTKHVNNTEVTTKNIKGEDGRYDIATKGAIPNNAADMTFSLNDCGITSASDDNSKRIKDGDNAMFTKNTYTCVYGDTSDKNDNFDNNKGIGQRADSMFKLLEEYGLTTNAKNFGGNFITFPSLIWATMLCDCPDGADSWIARLSCGCRSVSSSTYKSNYFYLRLSGTKENPSENLKGYKMHDKVVYFPDYSVDVSDPTTAVKTATIFDTQEDLNMITPVADMSPYTSASNGYGQTLKLSDTDKKLYQNIFMTYAFAEFNYEDAPDAYDETKHVVDLMCNWDAFPSGSGNIDFTYIEDTTGKEIESFVYYLLHPTKGIAYVATWFKNKIAGILLALHESIVGSSDSNYTTGMTRYLGTSSYTTMPKLTDIKLLANILSMYKNLMIYLILAMLLVIFCFVIVGELTVQRGLCGLLCFALLAFLPPYMINASANISNLFSDQIFSTKFEYWAISQMETYMDIINMSESDAVLTDNSLELATQVSLASASTSVGGASNTGYSGTMLKWMSPKKYASSLVSQALQTTAAKDSNASFLKSLTKQSATNASSGTGQEFVHNSDNALYLYRDYVDIYRYGSNSYNIDYYCKEFLNQDKVALIKSYTDNTSTQNKKEHGVYNVWHAKNGTSHGDTKNIPFSQLRTLTYSSGLAISDLINVNYEFGMDGIGTGKVYNNNKASTDGLKMDNAFKTTLDGTKSTYAVKHGFLYNTFGNTLNTKEGVNYFSYNNTRASTLLLSYAATVAQTQEALTELRDDLKNGKIKLTYDNFVTKGKYCYGMPHNSYNIDITYFNNLDDNYTDKVSDDDTTTSNDTKKATTNSKDTTNTTTNSSGSVTANTNSSTETTKSDPENDYKKLSDFYYDLYTESPYFYFNYNIRDQLINTQGSGYQFSNANRTISKNALVKLWLQDKQDYFYNYSSGAGDGYGELRDFMNFHDFFYYVIPTLQPGIDLLYEWDDYYGYYLYDDCSLKFTNSGTIKYDGKETEIGDDNKLSAILSEDDWNNLNEDDKYKLWHDYNVYSINLSYCSWLDTMEDCEYAKPETIRVMGEKYKVENPLDPTSYFSVAKKDFNDGNRDYKVGDIVAGRYMVFSRSEMAYYGLNWSDLTKVEQKIITVQDKVYEETLNLVNYQAVSDENLIHAFAMLETFIFNKEFSQKNVANDGGYIMYPQGYELKAFTYDAYLRLVLAESSDNIDLEVEGVNTNNEDKTEVTSIYKRIMDNTSIFFGVLLILNDILAVYVIPAIKILILIVLFFLSISMLISGVLKLELNIINNFIRSFLTPLLVFTGSCIALSFITSLFMSNGADYITEGKTTLSLGDPTMTLIIMIVLNGLYIFMNVKLLIKCYKTMIDYMKAIGVATIGAMTGAFKTIGNALTGHGVRRNIRGIRKGINNLSGGGSDNDNNPSNSGENNAKKRGGLNGIGAFASGAMAGAGIAHLADETSDKEYQNKLDFYNGNFDTSEKALEASKRAKKESDDLAKGAENYRQQHRKKHRSEINLEKSEAARKKYEMARADLSDPDVRLKDKVKVAGNSVKYGLSSKYTGLKANLQSKVEGTKIYKRTDRMLNGSEEFRGMSASQIRKVKDTRKRSQQLQEASQKADNKGTTLRANEEALRKRLQEEERETKLRNAQEMSTRVGYGLERGRQQARIESLGKKKDRGAIRAAKKKARNNKK